MKRNANGSWGAGAFHYRIDMDFTAAISAAKQARDETLQQLGDYIKGESTAIAPLRQGQLIESSYVNPPVNGKVEIGYNIIYAHRQHEGVSFFHPNGRQALYLSKVMEDPNTLSTAETMFGENLRKHLKLR